MELVFATNNHFKIEEIRALLGPFFQLRNLQEIGCNEELPETQNTIEGNSLQKADYAFARFGASCFADDTGLEVMSLNGEPGVFSARYAGEHKSNEDNIQLVLSKLRDSKNRKARFRSVITLVEPNEINTFEGIVEGVILHEKRGKFGFGYDSIFQPDGYDKTFAEMDMQEKNSISHRALAVNKLINFLKAKYS